MSHLCIDSILTEILIADDGELFKNRKLRPIGRFHEVKGLKEKRERLWIILIEIDLNGPATASGEGRPALTDHSAERRTCETDDGRGHKESFWATFEDDVASGSGSTDSNSRGGDGVSFWGSVDGEVLLLRKGRSNIDPAACQS
jgi:hypothetical protein